MAGTIEFLQGAIKHGKADWEKKFPAIEDVMVVHNTALAQICPMYMKQYLDSDKTAFYLLARCNPLKGDCSRQMACAWLEDLFYDKCGCPSSYDVEAGGTMSRKVAISKELLPADNDAEYMDFYQEQMAKMKEMFAAEQKAAKKEEFIAKNGFDPDDPDIIDVDVDEPAKALPGDGTTSVEQSAGTAVGMPKPIWYGAVFHANGFGMKLGYDKKVWTLSQGNTTIDKLGFNPAGPQLTEKEEDEMVGEALNGGASVPQLFDDLLAAVGKGTPIWNDLMDIKDKYNLDAVTVGLEESNISWGVRAAIKDLRIAIDRIANGGIVFNGFKEEADALFNKYFSKWAVNEEEVEDWYLDKDAVKRSFKEFKTIVLNTHGQSGLLAELNKLADKFGLEECEKCGDDDCVDGEKCGLNEVAGQDGVTPIAHAKTRNRMDKDPEYYIVVDQYRSNIPDYDSKFVMSNMQFTSGVTVRDFQNAWKTKDPKKAARFLLDVIKRYPAYNVALLRDSWTYAPVSFGGSAQRRPGCVDCWIHGDKVSGPGFWRIGAKHLRFLDRSIDFTLPTLQNVAEGEDGWMQKVVLKDATGKVVDSYEWECADDEQANSDGVIEAISKFDTARPDAGFLDANDEIFDTIVIDQKPWTNGIFTIELEPTGLLESKNPYDDVDEETDAEIREIIDEEDDRSDTEKEISEYEKVEDDIDEEDDELSESVIRHATMLAREIW